MSVAVILDFASGDSAAYDRVIENMDLGGEVPDGAVFHAAGPYEGGWRVVDVWKDAGTFQQFAQEKIGPLSSAEGLPEPSIEFVEVAESFDERNGGADAIGHVQVVRLDGMDEATFQDADSDIRDEGKAPQGCLFHINGPADDGWIVVDAWTDKGARDEFIATKVAPAMQARGQGVPTIEDLPVHNTLAPH